VFELNNEWIKEYPIGVINPMIGAGRLLMSKRIVLTAGAVAVAILCARYYGASFWRREGGDVA
jgi:hypothetical protein